jgi:hypothetical protein
MVFLVPLQEWLVGGYIVIGGQAVIKEFYLRREELALRIVSLPFSRGLVLRETLPRKWISGELNLSFVTNGHCPQFTFML